MAVTTAPSVSVPVTSLITGNKQRLARERRMRWLFRSAALFTFVVSAAIVIVVVEEAAQFFFRVDKASLWEIGWFPRRGLYDIATLFIASFIVTVVAMLVAAPLGLAAAIYLSEYARPRVRKTIKPILEVLAGIPSVVIGFFAITWINPELVQRFFSDADFFTLAAAGIGVGVLTLPIVASVSEDALRAVPAALREASYGLGARRLTTTLRVVFPAAISGIVAALVIGISRAIGETMVVAIAAGATGGSLRTWDALGPGQTLTGAMASLAYGSDQVKGDELAFQSLYFVGFLLFVTTLVLNVLSARIVNRFREEY